MIVVSNESNHYLKFAYRFLGWAWYMQDTTTKILIISEQN